MRQFRQNLDLFAQIRVLKERIETLETATRLGNASVDSGELTITGGNIVVRDSEGSAILAIIGGDMPQIVMQPNGGTDYQLMQLGWESPLQGAALQIGVQRLADGLQDGGKLLLMRDAAYLSHQPQGGLESFYSAGSTGQGVLYMKGKFSGAVIDGEAAVVAGSTAIAAGVSTYTYTYATPMTTVPAVVYGLYDASGTLVSHMLTDQTVNGFTVKWSGTAAKTINFWAFRV